MCKLDWDNFAIRLYHREGTAQGQMIHKQWSKTYGDKNLWWCVKINAILIKLYIHTSIYNKFKYEHNIFNEEAMFSLEICKWTGPYCTGISHNVWCLYHIHNLKLLGLK